MRVGLLLRQLLFPQFLCECWFEVKGWYKLCLLPFALTLSVVTTVTTIISVVPVVVHLLHRFVVVTYFYGNLLRWRSSLLARSQCVIDLVHFVL